MFDEAFERFPRKVQTVEFSIAVFELGHDAQRLGVVIETEEAFHASIKRVFACVAERRVAEVMRQCQCFGEVFVEPQHAADRTGDLGDFQ